MALINLTINTNPKITGLPDTGQLDYQYAPFRNLRLKEPDEITGDLGGLRVDADKANLEVNVPLEMSIEEAYDKSANIVINDKKNPPKIINSRFYLTGENTYAVGDRRGNLDTNIYSEDTFSSESSLLKTVRSVVKTDFLGINEGGNMSVGSYYFYFKLSDADGNESDFISESGKVVCHIGGVNQPRFIRGGLLEENSLKSVKFRLRNLDLAYNYINIYYTVTSGSDDEPTTKAFKLSNPIRINGVDTEFSISGYEPKEAITLDDINIAYTQFNSSKSIENCQNMAFAGNVTHDYSLYTTLEKYSLLITPQIATDKDIGNLSENYTETINRSTGYEYYNVDNIYYKLGLWDEEIYRYGIVYILNNYTLSPVFNIRGINELTDSPEWDPFSTNPGEITLSKDSPKLIAGENNIIEGTKGLQNSKGIFKISHSSRDVFSEGSIKPIGLKFKFHSNVINGIGGLKDITKGFFIVRQRRIPTILAQAVGIATTKHGGLPTFKADKSKFLAHSFLQDANGKPRVARGIVELGKEEVYNNALWCPEASLRTSLYNSYFNSSEYVLKPSKYEASSSEFKKTRDTHYALLPSKRSPLQDSLLEIPASLLLINGGTSLVRNGNYRFAAKAGMPEVASSFVDIKYGDFNDPTNTIKKLSDFNNSSTKIRGDFLSYIGLNKTSAVPGKFYNIYQQGYDFENKWRDYFTLRASDASPYYPVGDRTEWSDFKNNITDSMYRGDCYISTVTQRLNRNFIDPELPTNKNIVDPYTWYKNFKVVNKVDTVVEVGDQTSSSNLLTLQYNKLLPLFTYKEKDIKLLYVDEADEVIGDNSILDPENKHYKKYSESNGIFGTDKINRIDLNSVGLGMWMTTKICSNYNIAFRDHDPSNPQEEAIHSMKRSFYPLQEQEPRINLPESTIINQGISKTSGEKIYFELGETPFIQTHFPTRIYYSEPLQQTSFINGNRVFVATNYRDYTNEHGSITKLIEWRGSLVAVMEHGILLIPVNERSMMANTTGENVYINTSNVLPQNPRVLSSTFGSLWPESIIKTDRYIYGIDTVGKKIWRTDGESFENISDLKIQKFLNDNILLRENQKDNRVGRNYVKSHYNAFKHDIMFTFRYAQKKWNICYNELLDKWITRYTWFPEFSENINNIFYTFADTRTHPKAENYLYKHGFSGSYGERGIIKSANWYDEQHKFEFEFVVSDTQGVQKIFDNLNIISNKVEPNSIVYEFIGDSYDWEEQKEDIWELSDLPTEPRIVDEVKGFGQPFNKPF